MLIHHETNANNKATGWYEWNILNHLVTRQDNDDRLHTNKSDAFLPMFIKENPFPTTDICANLFLGILTFHTNGNIDN